VLPVENFRNLANQRIAVIISGQGSEGGSGQASEGGSGQASEVGSGQASEGGTFQFFQLRHFCRLTSSFLQLMRYHITVIHYYVKYENCETRLQRRALKCEMFVTSAIEV
jgi:hypothetical protein